MVDTIASGRFFNHPALPKRATYEPMSTRDRNPMHHYAAAAGRSRESVRISTATRRGRKPRQQRWTPAAGLEIGAVAIGGAQLPASPLEARAVESAPA